MAGGGLHFQVFSHAKHLKRFSLFYFETNGALIKTSLLNSACKILWHKH